MDETNTINSTNKTTTHKKTVRKKVEVVEVKEKPSSIVVPDRPPPTPCMVELRKRILTPYPVIMVITHEETRVIEGIMEYVIGRKTGDGEDEQIEYNRTMDLFVWSVTQGLIQLPRELDPVQALSDPALTSEIDDSQDPLVTLSHIHQVYQTANGVKRGIFVMRDFHKFITDQRIDIVRKVRDIAESLSMKDKVLVITAPDMTFAPELEKLVSVIDFDLPTKQEIDYEIRLSLNGLAEELNDQNSDITSSTDVGCGHPIKLDYTDEEIEQIGSAMLGLDRFQIWCVMGKCIEPGDGTIDVPTILAEKEQIVAKSGILEFWKSPEQLDDVGGLGVVKNYVHDTKFAFKEAAKAFRVDDPRGILLLGKPGTAKSLIIKASANYLKLPCLRMDIGKIMAGVVGGSEGNTRRALKTAEAIAPCILWLDEIEKGLSGTGSSNFSDAGTMSRVFGTIMQWMQDRQAPVYLMATANNISQLPPELLRKGRFDEIFFVDLPVHEEKVEIFRIHLRKRDRDPERFNLEQLADIMYTRRGKEYPYSGAEIEAAIQESIRKAFARAMSDNRTPEINTDTDIDTDSLSETMSEIVPLSCTYAEEMVKMRKWARDRARYASKLAEEQYDSTTDGHVSVENKSGSTLTADLNLSATTGAKKKSGFHAGRARAKAKKES